MGNPVDQRFVGDLELTGGGPSVTAPEILRLASTAGVTFPVELVAHFVRWNGGRPNANWVQSEDAEAPGEDEPGLNCPIDYFLPVTGAPRTVFSVREELRELGLDVAYRFPLAERGRSYTYWIDLDPGPESYGRIVRRKPKRSSDLLIGRWLYFCIDFQAFLGGLNRINYKP